MSSTDPVCTGFLGRWLRSNRSIGRAGKVVGMIHVGLGARLAFQQR
jgi:hypothetical protein